MSRFYWTPERHAALVAARTRCPGQSDAATAAELRLLPDMRGVTSKMVRDRWNNHVEFDYRPTLAQMDEWTPMVVELVERMGNRWARIGPVVRGRLGLKVSNEVVKRIWNRRCAWEKAGARAGRAEQGKCGGDENGDGDGDGDGDDTDPLPYALREVFEAELSRPAEVGLDYLPVPDTPKIV
eukprot:jgi/Tetstr1/463992/TSEL_008797.t1